MVRRWRWASVAALLALLTSLALMAVPYAFAEPLSPSWFSVTVKPPYYVILGDSLFYYINVSLAKGLMATYWYVNVSSPSLVRLTPTPNTVLKTPLIALAQPNSTIVPLPGDLSEVPWNASLVTSSGYSDTVLFWPLNSSVTYPFKVHVYVTASAYEPYLTYAVVIMNNGSTPAWTTVAYGIGAISEAASNWTAAVAYLSNNGTVVKTLSNATEAPVIAQSVSAVASEGSEPLFSIGIAPVTDTYYVELLEGKLFGINVSSVYVLAVFRTPVLQPGQNYTIIFKAYSVWFNPLELAAVNALPIAAYEYPSLLVSNLTGALSYIYEESLLKSNISNLTAQISSLKGQVNNLSAKLYYYGVQVKNLQRSSSYYAGVAHRSGLLAAGLFVAGIVIGLLGGAYLLSPTGREALSRGRQQQPRKR